MITRRVQKQTRLGSGPWMESRPIREHEPQAPRDVLGQKTVGDSILKCRAQKSVRRLHSGVRQHGPTALRRSQRTTSGSSDRTGVLSRFPSEPSLLKGLRLFKTSPISTLTAALTDNLQPVKSASVCTASASIACCLFKAGASSSARNTRSISVLWDRGVQLLGSGPARPTSTSRR